MTATLPDISITNVWQDVHVLSGATPGAEIGIQNKERHLDMVVQVKATQPSAGDTTGFPVASYPNPNSYVTISADAVNKTWCRLVPGNGSSGSAQVVA